MAEKSAVNCSKLITPPWTSLERRQSWLASNIPLQLRYTPRMWTRRRYTSRSNAEAQVFAHRQPYLGKFTFSWSLEAPHAPACVIRGLFWRPYPRSDNCGVTECVGHIRSQWGATGRQHHVVHACGSTTNAWLPDDEVSRSRGPLPDIAP